MTKVRAYPATAALLIALAALPPAADAAKRAAAPAATADTLRLSLDDAVRLALGQGPESGIAKAQWEAAKGRVREVGGQALPQINGTGTYTKRFASVFSDLEGDSLFGPIFSNTSFAAQNTWIFDLTASQILFSPRVWSAVGAARAYERTAGMQRAQTDDDVRLEARRAYLLAAYRDELVRIAEEGLVQARAYEQDVELQHREGSRAEYDLLQARVDARNAEPPVLAARSARASSLLELKRLLGLAPGLPVVLATPLEYENGMLRVANLDTLAAPARAAVAAAEANVDFRKRALGAEGGARWPTLVASASVSQQAYPSEVMPERDEFFRNSEASARLEFPLFQGTQTIGAVARARAELRQAEIELGQARAWAEIDFRNARDEVQRALSVLAARRGTVQLATRAYELARIRYDNGLSTQLEVSDSRLRMLTARATEADALRDYRAALAGLEHALGRPLATTDVSMEELPRLVKETLE